MSESQNWERDNNPIDKKTDACLEGPDQSTAGTAQCWSDAYGQWDKEMNNVYKELLSTLPRDQKAQLQEDQRNWLKFRDSELKVIDKIYDKDGTMFGPMEVAAKAELVKDRTLQLHNRLQIKQM